ncbi:unnamed protein product [Pleuronectes platessa]|uniref:Uncharacterized protein n=1 Tax=Pleuronectes platessa TaxID=8262 RepID=A0A9N7YEB1_PLEPL|nr:unnamed protein product [Pleuronectes platessa]
MVFLIVALCSLIRSAGSSPAVSSFAAAEQQLASFSARSGEGKAKAAGGVKKEKVEEDKQKEKKGRRGGGDLLLSIHPSPHLSLASAASAPLPTPPLLLLPLLDPPSPARICLLFLLRELFLELGGGGRSPPPSSAADPLQGIRRREGRKGGWKEGEGILEEVHRESRGKATPWVTEEQSGEEEKRLGGFLGRRVVVVV